MPLPRTVEALGGRGEDAHVTCALEERREQFKCVVMHGRLLSVNGVPVR